VSWHSVAETSPLRLEMLRFSQVSNKDAFDDVFVRYGRSLKPDLIVAQWNHLGDFSQIEGDERCLLPAELWGRDESYLWYSTGGGANTTDLSQHELGEGTLQARYIRGAFDDKPFTLGKYEATRIRATIAELAANGGAPMGFYTRFTEPAARAEIVRYYQFLLRHDRLYRGNRPHAEVTLLFPRTAVHRGDVSAVARFRAMGRRLLDAHVLFEVRPDDLEIPRADHVVTVEEEPGQVIARLVPAGSSQIVAPWTVRVSATRPAETTDEIDLHLVSYDRQEPPRGSDGSPSPGAGIADERPKGAKGIRADILLPQGTTVAAIRFLTPEREEEATLADFRVRSGRVEFPVPEFLVYGVVRILLRYAQ
jgi:hypothetical protein